MKRHNILLSNETSEMVQNLADAHTKGNFSAMVRRVLDQTVMPQEYEVYRRSLETMFVANDHKPKEA